MKDFHPAMTDDEALQEVWRIKDETAKRFHSVADYVQSLYGLLPVSFISPVILKTLKLHDRNSPQAAVARF